MEARTSDPKILFEENEDHHAVFIMHIGLASYFDLATRLVMMAAGLIKTVLSMSRSYKQRLDVRPNHLSKKYEV